jgi:acetyltransferase-like isoleucine patch superfamily enzyme
MAKLLIQDVVIIGVGYPDVFNIIDNINQKKKKINIIGFLDDNPLYKNKKFWGYRVLGKISWLKNKKNISVVNSVARNCLIREKVFSKIKKYNKNFINIIDPSVNLKNVKLSKGLIINKGATLGYGSQINFGTVLSWDSHIGHNSTVGKSCFISKGATVLGHVKISDRVFIGANSTIIQKVKILKDSHVFSNTTVLENLNANSFFIRN